MQKITRILIVVILAMIVVVVGLDYFGFHGDILLKYIGGGPVINVFDTVMNLFKGKDGNTNLAFFAVISIGLLVGLMAIAYKFIKG